MPKKKRGSGFTQMKRGRYHRGSGRRRGYMSRSDDPSEADDVRELDHTEAVVPCNLPLGDSSGNEKFPGSPVQRALDVGADYLSEDTKVGLLHLQPDICVASQDQLPQREEQRTSHDSSAAEKLKLLNADLPLHWKAIQTQTGYHVVLISRNTDYTDNIAIQRSVFAPINGDIKVFVHRKIFKEDTQKEILKGLETKCFENESSQLFVDKVLKVVDAVRSYEICAGVDQERYEYLWATDSGGFADNNPYDESRYKRTFRSNNCALLVPVRWWRCDQCKKVTTRFREKWENHQEEEANPFTRNTVLTDKQKLHKLKAQQKELEKLRKRIED